MTAAKKKTAAKRVSQSKPRAAAARKTALKNIDPVVRQAIEEACERAAKRATSRAVRDMLLLMGIDARTPEGLLATQKNNAFLNRVREAAESRPARFGLVLFSTLMSVIGGLIVYAVTHSFPFGPKQ